MFTQMPAFLVGALSSASVITTLFWNQWSVSGPTSKGVLGPIWAWRSLFGECIQYQGGQSQCQGQNSMFLMSSSKLAIRGMMIAALILSVLGCVGIVLGSECTKIFDHKRKMKRKIMFGCGIAFLLSGIFTFASVAWYTAIVYTDFFRIETQDNFIQWELGACVYLGYIASFLCVITFFICVCRPGPKEKSDEKKKSFYYKSRYYDVKSSRDDDELARNLLDRYKSYYSDSKSSRKSSSKHSSRKHGSSSKRSSRTSKQKDPKDHGHKNPRSVSFSSSSRSEKSVSIGSSDSGCSSDTYKYSEYV